MKTSLTLDDINTTIVGADYHHFPGTTTTVCCLTLRDGFTVIGYSACVDPASFDEATGRTIAHDDAVQKVWQLEGYLLNYKIKRGILAAEEQAADEAAIAAARAAEEQAAAALKAAEDAANALAKAAVAGQEAGPTPAPAAASTPPSA